MDRIEKLERSCRRQRLAILLLAVVLLIGAKEKITVFDTVEANFLRCGDMASVKGKTIRTNLYANKEASVLSIVSPDGKRQISIDVSDDDANIVINNGEHALVIDEELIDILNHFRPDVSMADDVGTEPAKK